MNKNSLIWAFIPTAIVFVSALFLVLISSWFGISLSNISSIAMVLGALFGGGAYAYKFKEVMPKEMKIKATTFYIISQVLLTLLFFPESEVGVTLGLVAFIIVFIILFLALFYWLLGSGGKQALKILEKYNK